MEFLTVKETAQLLRVSPITVRRYIASGRLAAERVGRGIRVRREAIEEFVTPVEPDESLGKAFTMDDQLRSVFGSGEADELDDSEYALELPTFREQLGNIVGIGRSGGPGDVSANKYEYLVDAIIGSSQDDEDDLDSDVLPGKPTTEDDPLWSIIGAATSDEPNDVASNKHKYVADAILADKSRG